MRSCRGRWSKFEVRIGPMRGWFGINYRESISIWQMRRKNHRGNNEIGCNFETNVNTFNTFVARGLIIKFIIILYFVLAPYFEHNQKERVTMYTYTFFHERQIQIAIATKLTNVFWSYRNFWKKANVYLWRRYC